MFKLGETVYLKWDYKNCQNTIQYGKIIKQETVVLKKETPFKVSWDIGNSLVRIQDQYGEYYVGRNAVTKYKSVSILNRLNTIRRNRKYNKIKQNHLGTYFDGH